MRWLTWRETFGCPCLPLGYVMDKQLGNTGGVGGIFGIFYAIG